MRFYAPCAAMLAALLTSPALAAEGGGGTPVALTTAADGYPGGVARMVAAIIEYTRWPTAANPVTVCVVGPAQYAGRLDGLRLSSGRMLQRRTVSQGDIARAGCEAVYLGPMNPAAMRQIVADVRGKGVLTIAEADPEGRSEAMFSLLFQPGSISFRLNIDAVSRSGLRVDPRVLRLSEGRP